jgi:hypothetical protein
LLDFRKTHIRKISSSQEGGIMFPKGFALFAALAVAIFATACQAAKPEIPVATSTITSTATITPTRTITPTATATIDPRPKFINCRPDNTLHNNDFESIFFSYQYEEEGMPKVRFEGMEGSAHVISILSGEYKGRQYCVITDLFGITFFVPEKIGGEVEIHLYESTAGDTYMNFLGFEGTLSFNEAFCDGCQKDHGFYIKHDPVIPQPIPACSKTMNVAYFDNFLKEEGVQTATFLGGTDVGGPPAVPVEGSIDIPPGKDGGWGVMIGTPYQNTQIFSIKNETVCVVDTEVYIDVVHQEKDYQGSLEWYRGGFNTAPIYLLQGFTGEISICQGPPLTIICLVKPKPAAGSA